MDEDTSKSSQGSAFFPCKKGDIVSKTVNGNTVGMIIVYGIRK